MSKLDDHFVMTYKEVSTYYMHVRLYTILHTSFHHNMQQSSQMES